MGSSMARISIELVPRSRNSLVNELQVIQDHLPQVNMVNVPDLLRFSLHSWEACQYATPFYSTAIPHLRAMDIDLAVPLPIAEFLEEHHLSEVLVIQGDPPDDPTHPTYPSTSIDVIKKIKKEIPHLKVYAALDPYRSSVRNEYEYLQRKFDAGADGLFTQPFFDLRLMEIYAEVLASFEVFWGISPVTTKRSQRYWETRNNVLFPHDFQPTLEWNRGFAQTALEFVQQRQSHIYFMPIRVGILEYLNGIL